MDHPLNEIYSVECDADKLNWTLNYFRGTAIIAVHPSQWERLSNGAGWRVAKWTLILRVRGTTRMD